MKVTHIFKTYFPDTQGGLEEVIRQIARYTTKCGVENHVLTVSPELTPGIIDYSEARVKRYGTFLDLFSTPMSLDFFRNFNTEIKDSDILHFHFPWPFGEVCYLLDSCNIPSIVTYHSDIVKQKVMKKVYKPLLNRFLDQVDIIVPTSLKYLDSSVDLKPFRRKCEVIPLTIDENRFPPEKPEIYDEIKRKYGENFFLFVGVLRYYKGLEYLIKAMEKVDNKLIIIGKGPERIRLEKMVKRLNLKNIHFLGFVDDSYLPAFYSLCKAFLFPSCERSEAFGMSLLEASYFAKPMISTELSTGTSYVNKHNETGIVVPPRNSDALYDAINTLNKNDALSIKFGLNAKKRFTEKFNSNIVGDQYMKLYKKIVINPTTKFKYF